MQFALSAEPVKLQMPHFHKICMAAQEEQRIISVLSYLLTSVRTTVGVSWDVSSGDVSLQRHTEDGYFWSESCTSFFFLTRVVIKCNYLGNFAFLILNTRFLLFCDLT